MVRHNRKISSHYSSHFPCEFVLAENRFVSLKCIFPWSDIWTNTCWIIDRNYYIIQFPPFNYQELSNPYKNNQTFSWKIEKETISKSRISSEMTNFLGHFTQMSYIINAFQLTGNHMIHYRKHFKDLMEDEIKTYIMFVIVL